EMMMRVSLWFSTFYRQSSDSLSWFSSSVSGAISGVLAPVVGMDHAAVFVGPRDRVKDQADLLGGRRAGAGRVDGVRRDPLDVGDATLADLDGEELLGGAVARGARSKELEGALDDLVVAQGLGQQRRRLVDSL